MASKNTLKLRAELPRIHPMPLGEYVEVKDGWRRDKSKKDIVSRDGREYRLLDSGQLILMDRAPRERGMKPHPRRPKNVFPVGGNSVGLWSMFRRRPKK